MWLLLLASVHAYAAESLTLPQSIDRALTHNKELKSQKWKTDQAESDRQRVGAEFGPHIEALAGIGPITKAIGNAALSTEYKSSYGRMIMGKISVTQPLYAWGRSARYLDAAQAGIVVEQAAYRQKEEDVRLQVKEAFVGYQLTNSLLDFITSAKSDLEKARADRKNKKGAEKKDDLRLDIFTKEVESREAEVKKNFELAKEGLSLRLGAERGSVLPKQVWLLPDSRQKQTVEFYVQKARGQRSEFTQLEQGILAKHNLAKAEKLGAFPVLAILGSYEIANTNVRTPQPGGVFAYDPYNRQVWALGVGLKLDLQSNLPFVKAAKYEAEAEELIAKQDFAQQGIEIEVRKAYLDLEEAETRLQATTDAYKISKKWLTSELIGFSAGLGSSQNLVEAYGARAETAKSYFEALYRHYLAWAQLSHAVGQEVDPSF